MGRICGGVSETGPVEKADSDENRGTEAIDIRCEGSVFPAEPGGVLPAACHRRPRIRGAMAGQGKQRFLEGAHARISLTTRDSSTPVSLKSRPWNL